MSAKPRHVTLMGVAVILSTIAPVPAFAEFKKTELEVQELYKQWDVQELYKQCKGGSFGEVFCLEFVSRVARQVFTNGLALKDIKDPPDLMTMSIPSACPKSSVSNDAMVEAFNEWANEHLEKWNTSADAGVMQAMHDTWPCR